MYHTESSCYQHLFKTGQALQILEEMVERKRKYIFTLENEALVLASNETEINLTRELIFAEQAELSYLLRVIDLLQLA